MKFLHLGDLHLGRTLGEYDLEEDQQYILNQILEIAEREKADAVIIAGDVYDKAIPSEAAVRMLNGFLKELAARKTRVFLISGNHDSDERLNFGSSLFEANGIYISAVFDGTLHRHVIRDEYGEVDVYLLPFVKASRVRHYYPDEEITSYEDAVRVIIRQAGIDTDRRCILAAHQFVAGKGGDPVPGGSEGLSVHSVGLVEKIGYDCFDGFDYAALGHIHSPQQVGRAQVRYCGSPLKYSLSEADNSKSVPVVELGPKGTVQIDLVPLVPLRDLRHIRGPVRKLLDPQNLTDTEDYIYATLTDEEMLTDVMGLFRQEYPRTVKIDYDNSRTRQLEQVETEGTLPERSFPELISDFDELVYGCEISEEEMRVMRQEAGKAGVMYEAD